MTVSHAFYCATIIAMHVLSVYHTHSHADGNLYDTAGGYMLVCL